MRRRKIEPPPFVPCGKAKPPPGPGCRVRGKRRLCADQSGSNQQEHGKAIPQPTQSPRFPLVDWLNWLVKLYRGLRSKAPDQYRDREFWGKGTAPPAASASPFPIYSETAMQFSKVTPRRAAEGHRGRRPPVTDPVAGKRDSRSKIAVVTSAGTHLCAHPP